MRRDFPFYRAKGARMEVDNDVPGENAAYTFEEGVAAY